jgi:hypothetical protein
MKSKSESFVFAPVRGWSGFTRGAELQDYLWERLSLVGFGGIWHYYNFTSSSSLWSADSSPDNSIMVIQVFPVPADAPKILEIVVCLTDNDSEHFVQLSAVVRRLISGFGLSGSPIPSETGSS